MGSVLKSSGQTNCRTISSFGKPRFVEEQNKIHQTLDHYTTVEQNTNIIHLEMQIMKKLSFWYNMFYPTKHTENIQGSIRTRVLRVKIQIWSWDHYTPLPTTSYLLLFLQWCTLWHTLVRMKRFQYLSNKRKTLKSRDKLS